MKRKSLVILVSFLMVLYIGPLILAPSSMGVPISAEQNTHKDFLVASGESWLFGWDYRKEITIIGVAGSDTNYQVNLTVAHLAGMQNDWDDIRFTEDDGITELDYWMEDYHYGMGEDKYAWFWIEVTDNLNTNQTIYMYYGNNGASTTSNGDTTFLMYEDWASESVRGAVWDIISGDGGITYAGGGASHGTIARVEGNAAASYKITSDFDTAAPIAIMFRSNIEEAGDGNTARQGSGSDAAFGFALVQTAVIDQFYVYDDDGNQDSQAMNDDYWDSWITFQITRDGTNTQLYADTVLIKTGSWDPDIITTNPATSIMVGDSEDDIYSDWVAVRKFKAGAEPVIDALGAEEEAPPIAWNQVGIAQFIFHIGWDPTFQFGYDALLIFAGLIMIPMSTMYLVRGGREKLSMEKTFYFLIIFMVGLGLLIGGIMP